MKNAKVINGFVWLIISKDKARDVFTIFNVYALHEDGTESGLFNLNDIDAHEGEYAIEVGFLSQLNNPSTHDTCCECGLAKRGEDMATIGGKNNICRDCESVIY